MIIWSNISVILFGICWPCYKSFKITLSRFIKVNDFISCNGFRNVKWDISWPILLLLNDFNVVAITISAILF